MRTSSRMENTGDPIMSVSSARDTEKCDKSKKDDKRKIFGFKLEYGTQPWHILWYHPSVYKSNIPQLLNEMAAGLTVAFAQVSDSLAFSYIAGVGPLLGLHAAWIIGLSLSFFGSRPGMINGATGVRAAVIAPYVAQYGTAYLFYIVLMISVYQLLAGLLKLSKYVRLVPRSVMIGFVNGLAIILTKGQFFTFRNKPNPKLPDCTNATNVTNCNEPLPTDPDTGLPLIPYISDGPTLGFMVMYVVIVAATIVLTPLIPKVGRRIPASLLGIGIVTLIEWVILRPSYRDDEGNPLYSTPTIGEVSNITGGFPIPFFSDPQYQTTDPRTNVPKLDFEVLKIVAWPAFVSAAAGAVEAVLTMEVVNDMTETTNERPNQQLIALSIGNFVSGIFGTMGGGATIGPSVINCTNGANGWFRLSGIVAGIIILVFILVASPFIDVIPTASLTGVMAVCIYQTFDWESLPIVITTFLPMKIRTMIDTTSPFSGMRKIKRTDAITIILVTVVTVIQDLFIAVAAGIVFTAAVYAWEIGNDISLDSSIVKDENGEVKKKIYKMKGPLFFASAMRFITLFNPKTDPDLIEIHFIENGAFINDHSAIHSLNVIGEKYQKYNKRVVVKHLGLKSQKLTTKASRLIKTFTIELDDVGLKNGEVNPSFEIGEKQIDVGNIYIDHYVPFHSVDDTNKV